MDARSDDEAALVDAIRSRDPDAFKKLVGDLHPGLVRMASQYVPVALAEEIVQDTWMAVVTSIDGFEGRSKLKTWIYRIMLNKVRTAATREAKIIPFASAGPASGPHGPSVDPDKLLNPELGAGYWPSTPPRWETQPAARLESAETQNVVRQAIAQLPPAQREVVSLRDLEGWTSDEVCDALGITSANQRVLLHRGRVAVRNRLERHFNV